MSHEQPITDPNVTTENFIQFGNEPDLSLGLLMISKNEKGSKLLERVLAHRNQMDIGIVFEVMEFSSELVRDHVGSYVVLSLLDVCNGDQQMQIVHDIARDSERLLEISCLMHGTKVVQKLIEIVRRQEDISHMVSLMKKDIKKLIINENGKSVIQKCLEHWFDYCGEFICEFVFANCMELAFEPHGSCVVQDCVHYSRDTQRALLVSKIAANALILSQDPFGTKVIQHVLQPEFQWAVLGIMKLFEGRFTNLSMNEFSWRVIEKGIKLSDDKHLASIIKELTSQDSFHAMMLDPYGSSIIQAALKYSKGDNHDDLLEAITPHLSSLQNNPFGEKVLSALN